MECILLKILFRLQAKYVNACLRQEIKDNQDILQEMERTLQYVSNIEEVFAEAGGEALQINQRSDDHFLLNIFSNIVLAVIN